MGEELSSSQRHERGIWIIYTTTPGGPLYEVEATTWAFAQQVCAYIMRQRLDPNHIRNMPWLREQVEALERGNYPSKTGWYVFAQGSFAVQCLDMSVVSKWQGMRK